MSVLSRAEAAVLMKCSHRGTMGDADRMRLDRMVLHERKVVVADRGWAGDFRNDVQRLLNVCFLLRLAVSSHVDSFRVMTPDSTPVLMVVMASC